MDIEQTFSDFCDNLKLTSHDHFSSSTKKIAKILNQEYYDSDSESDHLYIVGSIGRTTALNGVSDIDVLFDLPRAVYDKFNAYESNGQSALLQEVKNVLKPSYPKTQLKGDGQIVSIPLQKYQIELVPAFLHWYDENFDYPDTHDDGSWKTTMPIPEQEKCKEEDDSCDGLFGNLCRMLRCWKNNKGFVFNGLLIDTLTYNFLCENYYFCNNYADYVVILTKLFKYLSEIDENITEWSALGSGQGVTDNGKGSFIKKAKKAHRLLENVSERDLETNLVALFGKKIQKYISDSAIEQRAVELCEAYSYYPVEEFIENKYPVEIEYPLAISCIVSQNGFRPYSLKNWLLQHSGLCVNKSLSFVADCNGIPAPFDVYWKVRNEGIEAYKRRMIRGNIFKSESGKQLTENSNFSGNHFVECYIIKDSICVARAHINVPINSSIIDTENRY